jgi:hypothetical protein
MKLFERLFNLVCHPIALLVGKYDEVKARPKAEKKPEPELVVKTPKPRTRASASTVIKVNGVETTLAEAIAVSKRRTKVTEENINRIDKKTEDLTKELISRRGL